METTSQVARFIARRIETTDKLQKDIALQCGFEKPNMIAMVKQGRTRLPLGKVGQMAKALETDPVQLLKMCMEEYLPETWEEIAPLMESALTREELHLLTVLRTSTGSPFLSVLSDESKLHFANFIASLHTPATNQ